MAKIGFVTNIGTNILSSKAAQYRHLISVLITMLPSSLGLQNLFVKTFLKCGYAEVHPGVSKEPVFTEGFEAPRFIKRRVEVRCNNNRSPTLEHRGRSLCFVLN